MTTILNNVPPNTGGNSDSGYGFIIGVIVVIILVVLLVIYGLPMLLDRLDNQALVTETPNTPANNTTNTSSSTTINIELPAGTTTNN